LNANVCLSYIRLHEACLGLPTESGRRICSSAPPKSNRLAGSARLDPALEVIMREGLKTNQGVPEKLRNPTAALQRNSNVPAPSRRYLVGDEPNLKFCAWKHKADETPQRIWTSNGRNGRITRP